MEEEKVTGFSDTGKLELYNINKKVVDMKNRVSELLHQWSTNREEVVNRTLNILTKLNEWNKTCTISTTVGSSASLVGGVAVIGGLMFIPPIAVAGAVMSAVASTSNVATSIAQYVHFKRMIKELSRLIEHDEKLLNTFLKSYDEWQEYLEKLKNHEQHIKRHLRKSPFVRMIQYGWIATLLARLLVKISKSSTSGMVKGFAHASAAIGIAMDIASLVSDVKDLSSGAKSDLDSELRQAAEKLEIERMEILRTALIELE